MTTNKYAYIKYYGHSYSTREANPDDPWDRDATATDWTIEDEFVISKDKYGTVPLTFDPDPNTPYYAVYYIWSTGDSFGHYERAYCEIHGLYETRDEAEKEAARLRGMTDYSVPWNGYFESLDELEVKTVYLK